MNRVLRASTFFLVALFVLIAPMARAADGVRAGKATQVNLLRLPNVKLEETTAPANERSSLRALTDNDPATVAQITAEKGSTVDIVYGFGGDIVTVERLVIHLPTKMPSGASAARAE